jgi:SAM-dependent methyltransferase
MPSEFARYYDAVMKWEKRLAREMPLLEELARQAGSRILVPACGTGGHVVSLAERGFQVLGFDIDETAIEITRHKIAASAAQIAAAGGEARSVQLSMEEAATLGPQHDVAFCLGNALPGISEPGRLATALRGVAGALRKGGIFFTQNLNYDRRWKEKAKLFPLLSGETPDEEVLLVRFADYETEFINMQALFLTRPKAGGGWQTYPRASRQIPLFKDRMTKLLVDAGFANLHFWGDYAKSPFDSDESNDLIIAAEKS